MTALELIQKSAIMLNIDEVLNDTSLSSVTALNSDSVLENNFALNRMFEIVKIMITQLSTDYIQCRKSINLTTTNKCIAISSIDNLMKVIRTSINNVSIPFKIIDGNITFNIEGTFKIEYYAYPQINTLVDSVQLFNGAVGVDLLVYGLNSLYCLAMGLFDEFNVYNSIYNEKLTAVKQLKIIDMPCRSWE